MLGWAASPDPPTEPLDNRHAPSVGPAPANPQQPPRAFGHDRANWRLPASAGARIDGGGVGYFAVLSAPDGPAFRVRRCHLNLWSLATLLPGRRHWYLDVGVHIEALPPVAPADDPAGLPPSPAAPSNAVTAFHLRLPVDVETGGEKDLYETLSSQDIAELVFGGPVTLTTDPAVAVQRLSFADGDLVCARIDDGHVVRADDGADPYTTIVTVPLQRPVQPGESRYFRMRFRVYRPGPTWRWRGPWLARTGGRLDLRVNDVRESRSAAAERVLRERVLPIEALNVFVVLPRWLKPTLANPDLAYVRTLEAGAWTSYLHGAPHVGKPDRLTVHYWKHSARPDVPADTAAVTNDKPFRVFLETERHSPFYGWWGYLRIALGVLLALAIVGPGLQAARAVDLPDPSTSWITWVAGSTLLAVIGAIAFGTKLVQTRFRAPRLFLRATERWLLGRVAQR